MYCCRTHRRPLRTRPHPRRRDGQPAPVVGRCRTPTRTSSQDAYEVEVTRDGTEAVTVESGEQVLVPWPVSPLVSREQAHGPGPGARRRRLERVERTRHGRGRIAGCRRLDRAFREPGGDRRPRAPAPVVSGRRDAAGRHRAGPAVRHRARPVRRRAQRRAGRRRGAGAGLDRVPAPAALPDLRRHRPGRRPATTGSTCCSATAGSAAGWASGASARCTATGSRCWPSSR